MALLGPVPVELDAGVPVTLPEPEPVALNEPVPVRLPVKELVAVTFGVPLGVATSRPAGRHGSATPLEENAAGTAA